MTGRSELELRIEELVLHGFHPGDRYAIAGAVERELTALLSDRPLDGPPSSFGMEAASIDVPGGATPEVVGRQIARAIHEGLTSPTPAGPARPPR